MEAKRMYGNLGLIGTFAQGGQARVLWRMAQLYEEAGKHEDADFSRQHARELYLNIGCSIDRELTSADFDALVPPLDR
jgi:hypothetical protein